MSWVVLFSCVPLVLGATLVLGASGFPGAALAMGAGFSVSVMGGLVSLEPLLSLVP